MKQNAIPRLTPTEAIIMRLLMKGKRELYGLQIVREGDVSRGSIYVLLDRLEEKGMVESRLEDKPQDRSGMPRRLYKATGYGARVYSIWQKLAELGELRPALA